MLIAACDPDSPEAQALLEELSATLTGITGSTGKASFAADDTRVPRCLFVVARADNGQLLGCAALRPLEGDVGQVKRMYARPGTRGIGAVLLGCIEQAATGCFRSILSPINVAPAPRRP